MIIMRLIKICLILLCTLTSVETFAQADPVQWIITSKKIGDAKYEVHVTAILAPSWYIYSQSSSAEGPSPAKMKLNGSTAAVHDTTMREEGKLEQKIENNTAIRRFSDKADFIKVVTLRNNAKTVINGELEYVLGNDKETLPARILPFVVLVGGK